MCGDATEALVDVLRALVAAGIVPSSSAAASTAIKQWLGQVLIRFTLDEVYAEQPDLRPTDEAVAAMGGEMAAATWLGTSPPPPIANRTYCWPPNTVDAAVGGRVSAGAAARASNAY